MTPYRRTHLSLFVALGLWLAAPDAGWCGLDRWTSVGPPIAKSLTQLTVDPFDSSTLYLESERSGAWRSRDGGESWQVLDFGQPANLWAFGVDPLTPGSLYAVLVADDCSPTILHSSNRGDTWSVVADDTQSRCTHQIVVTNRPGTLYMAGGGVHRSTDGGRTWTTVYDPSSSGAIAVDPNDADTVYVTSFGFVQKTTDGGATWTPIIEIRPGAGFGADLLQTTASSSLLYSWQLSRTHSQPCVSRSDDGGLTWTGYLFNAFCSNPAVDPADPLTVHLIVEPEHRLWTSRDGGETWTQGDPAPDTGILASGPEDSLFLLGSQRLYKTTDAGATWKTADRGISTAEPVAAAVSPEGPGVLYVAYTAVLDQFFRRTDDGGRTWTDLPLANVTALALDRRDPRHVYAAVAGPEESFVFESRDRGQSWQRLSVGSLPRFPRLPAPRVTELVVDPRRPSLLYAATSTRALLRSRDGGRTWTDANSGLPMSNRCFNQHACPGNTVQAVVLDPHEPQALHVVYNGRVYRSANQGRSWMLTSDGLPFDVTSLTVDAATRDLFAGTRFNGIFRSRDGGRRWAPVAPLLPLSPDAVNPVADLAFDGRGGTSRLYAATESYGAFRSTDGGNSWTPLAAGLPTPQTRFLHVDPTRPGRLYVATVASGLFQGRFTPP